MTLLTDSVLNLVEIYFGLKASSKNIDFAVNSRPKLHSEITKNETEDYIVDDPVVSRIDSLDLSWSKDAPKMYQDLEIQKKSIVQKFKTDNSDLPLSKDLTLYAAAQLWHPNRTKKTSLWAVRDLTVTSNIILSQFHALRLVNKKISQIDSDLASKLPELRELILVGNLISKVQSVCFPSKLQVLDLSSNLLQQIPVLSTAPKLEYLGLAYNSIALLRPGCGLDSISNVRSLDLSYNGIYDYEECLRSLGTLPNLVILKLNGNPICLAAFYRPRTAQRLTALRYLDDVLVTYSDRAVVVPEKSLQSLGIQIKFVSGTCNFDAKQYFAERAESQAPVLDCADDQGATVPNSEEAPAKAESRPPSYEAHFSVEFASVAPAGSETNLNILPVFTSQPFLLPGTGTSVPVLESCEYQLPLSESYSNKALWDGFVVSLSIKQYRFELIAPTLAPESQEAPAPAPSNSNTPKAAAAPPKGKKAASHTAAAAVQQQVKSTNNIDLQSESDAQSTAKITELENQSPGCRLMTAIPEAECQTSTDVAISQAYQLKLSLGVGSNTGSTSTAAGSNESAPTAKAQNTKGNAANSKNSKAQNAGSNQEQVEAAQPLYRKILVSERQIARGVCKLQSFLSGKIEKTESTVSLHELESSENPPYIAPSVLEKYKNIGEFLFFISGKSL